MSHPDGSHRVDVAIVGGGLSGLSAAKALKDAGKTFMVLEARDRVGGRVLNINLKSRDGVVDAGAAFIGATRPRALALAQSLGIKLFPTYDKGHTVLYLDGKRSTFDSEEGFPFETEATECLENAVKQLDDMAASIVTTAPWSHASAHRWDVITFQQWLDDNVRDASAKSLLSIIARGVYSAEPHEISLLFAVSYIAAAGDESHKGTLARVIGTSGGGQQWRVEGGAQKLPIGLAAQVGEDNIAFGHPVQSIQKTEARSYIVTTARGLTVHAKKVIVAMSPPLAGRISYSPPLPAKRDRLTQQMPMGAIGKAMAIYDCPFWRKENLNGQLIGNEGAIGAIYDVSPEDGSYGALMCFIEADGMRRLDEMSAHQIETESSRAIIKYFGDGAGEPREWIVQKWDDGEFSRGGPVAHPTPGTLVHYGEALRASIDGLIFAGTETADYWVGYMEGALRSGEFAAKQALAAL